MPELANKSQCTGCTACMNICPKQCIQMVKDEEGFMFPKVLNISSCINCGSCEKICPILNDKKNDDVVLTTAYAAISNNDLTRMGSSSGGIFTELATHLLKTDGIIYGASYDEMGIVKHVCINNIKNLGKLRGAKYSQSDLGEIMKSIKKQLETGKTVLFSGTPCQVAGLKAFLKHDYNNLICIDFVCHGVPSPMIWEKYIQYRAQADNNGVISKHINLRNKESGWSHYSYSVEFDYSDNKRYLCKNGDDPFMHLFINDYILRKSCSDCKFKGYHRISDITLGDFWGVWDILPEMDDNKGTSLVLLHTEKGKRLFRSISDKIKTKEISLEQASQMNPSVLKSSVHKPNRESVLKSVAENGFESVIHITQSNNVKESFWNRIKRHVGKALK